MQDGAPLVYQATLFDGQWQGRADFLRRIDFPSQFGDYGYEVLDTKLARSTKPEVVHQLSLYNRLLTKAQVSEAPRAHVLLGNGSIEPIDLRKYAALHRHVVGRVERMVSARGETTYPEPVAHCAICALGDECYARWIADDHLSLVAGARREYRASLVEAGLPTVAELGNAPSAPVPNGLSADRFDLLRIQARLQVSSRESGKPTRRQLPPTRAAGYATLPPPSHSDVFFDLEGDPYVGDGGLEYLWGWWTADGYEAVWAHNEGEEKAAFEQFVDRLGEYRARFPELHVFHYAPHERSKLRSLATQYATREEEIDELLRSEVLVDLYAVVRHGLQVGEESYSLKKLERHHGFERLEKRVREGGGSIVAYEAWLETGAPDLLEAIRAYNEEDCRSTASLRDWLQNEMLPEAAAEFDVDFADYADPEPHVDYGAPEWLPDVLALIDRLTTGPPADRPAVDLAERELLGDLLLYHRRESKPGWWRYFDLRGKPVSDLIEDRDAIAGLVRDESILPTQFKRSLDYTFTFPAQEFRLDKGDAQDPTTGEGHKVVEVSDDRVIVRCSQNKPPPAPVALIGGSPINTKVLREALIDLSEAVLAGTPEFRASRSLLRREPPALKAGELGESIEGLTSAALGLDESVLPVQGPPGTGKTFRAARMILAALDRGLRVGVSGPSHSVIQNLLTNVEEAAVEQGRTINGIYKGSAYESPHGLINSTEDNGGVGPEYMLIAGTAWLFARPEHRGALDILFIDEAGQYSLANATAAALAAKSLVILGDPQQLPQVNQANHPGGSGASALGHILGEANTLSPEEGVLLTESWRMHPDVCTFVSERSYDSRLRSRPDCSRRMLTSPGGELSGVGLRRLAVEHEGRSQASPEEAEAIGIFCRELLIDGMVTNAAGELRKVKAEDILVVAPYNLAVRRIRAMVPEGVRVGTVDRFQGQQAPVVFYALTCSSAEDAPRGLDFLFDAHRLNVAVSRAQCLAVLVHSPRILDVSCPNLNSMQLLDGLCRFVELGTPLPSPLENVH